MLIVFEGLDGAGKRTHVSLLAKYLRKKKRKVVIYNYPDRKGPYYKVIQDFLQEKIELTPTTQLLTFLADIAKDQSKIFKDISDGKIVLVDRYVFSTIAYQNLPEERACEVVKNLKFLRPHMVFYLDISPDVAFSRIRGRRGIKTRYELSKEKLLLARIKYLAMASECFMCPWIQIDANRE
ncbi:MAG: dTMP kinase, partial [Candidatus Micrarchaeia archaeon]